MCGILGGNIKKWDYEAGIVSLRHRGPDGFRIDKLENCTLAFARLAVMDLNERAMQPMYSETKDVCILFNGEIYGYQPLRKKLEQKYKFYTTSDTEVVLNAYMEYGDEFIRYIDGMFALVLYDKRTQELKLYRDRAGIKPLYYYCTGSKFAFASELKALEKALSGEKLEIDYTALYDYLFYRYIPTPKSLYKNCFKLPPAYRLVYSLRTNKIEKLEKYWTLHVNTAVARKRKKGDIEEALRYYISKSVKEQMVADVPVGTYLSGGIDSSIISYYCHKIDNGVNAFSVGFREPQYDETKYAEIIKNKYEILFHNLIFEAKDIYSGKGMMKEWCDEPFADVAAYPTYELSKLAKKYVTVVLTGDGGDELFGGYPSAVEMKAVERGGAKIKDILFQKMHRSGFALTSEFGRQNMLCSPFRTFYESRLAYRNQEIDKYAAEWGIPDDYDVLWYLKKFYISDLPPVTRSRYLDFKTYMHDAVLTKVDRVSMAVSLETRVPFLSRELIEYAFSLSEEECCPKTVPKGALKGAYSDILPEEILHRRKQGFNVPSKYFGAERKDISVSILQREWGIR